MRRIVLLIMALATASIGGAQEMAESKNNGTRIKIIIGSTVTSATLNDGVSARDLISRFPYAVEVSRSSVDFCGRLPQPLENTEDEAQTGWKNGDISYIPGADWIAFFFDGEEESAAYGNHQHIVGSIDDPSVMEEWPQGSFQVRMELY